MWIAYEEKETDVNIATALIEDAVEDRYDIAILVSGDSDLRPLLRVKRLRPERHHCAFPPSRHSRVLARAVDAYVTISHSRVHNAQLPPRSSLRGGVRLTRPALLELAHSHRLSNTAITTEARVPSPRSPG